MKHLLIAILLGACAAANAAPPCWVVSGAAGYTQGSNADGRYAGWWCARPWEWSRTLLVVRHDYTLIHPAPAAGAASTAEAYWKANVTVDCGANNGTNLPMQRLCDAAWTATDATIPPSRWIVSPYPGATYRATYPTSQPIDGTRTTTSNGRVLIVTAGQPTHCACALGRKVEGATTYCSVSGVAQTVANCRLR
jgi:hypothetical protein